MRNICVPGVALMAALLGAALGGCAIPGAIAYKVLGPSAVPARYVPPKAPMLILVEEANASTGAILESEELALALHEELKSHEVRPLIDPAALNRLRDADAAAFRQLGIADIGRRLGAAQVLYVAIRRLEFESPDGGSLLRGRIDLAVKVIDVGTAQIRWPTSSDGESYTHETPMVRVTPQNSAAAIRRALVQQAAVEVGRWFYPWKPETMSEENRDVKIR